MSDPNRGKIFKANEKSEDEEDTLKLKSKSAATPNSEEERFVANVVEILPPEVWEEIFKNVASPKDLLSCWKTTAAPSWRIALQSTDLYFKMTLPSILPYLSRNDLLNCSSVSKFWNGSVDACIQMAEDFGSVSRLERGQRIELTLYSDNIIHFINDFGLSTENEPGKKIVMNPVNFRRVELNVWIDEDEDHDAFFILQRNIITFLDHHGHLLRHLILSILVQKTVSLLNKIELIHNCLKRTPNLRVMLIQADAPAPHLLQPNADNQPNGELAEFNAFISKHPWPPLEHLKVLQFWRENNREELASIANAYAPQLVYFRFGFELREPHRPLSNRYCCLQKIIYDFDDSSSGMEFATFIQSAQCPLKHLYVELTPNYEDLDLEKCNGLVMAANAVSATLETLKFRPWMIYGGEGKVVDITIFEQLRLPKLKVLHLDPLVYPSLEFIKGVCPALQQLTLTTNYMAKRGEMLETEKMYRELYSQDHFWNDLPEIQSVSVEFNDRYRLYTRRKYEAKETEDDQSTSKPESEDDQSTSEPESEDYGSSTFESDDEEGNPRFF